jgi:fluoride exporter
VPARWGRTRGRNPEPAARILAIAVGGSLGTLARYEMGLTLVVSGLGFPWSTFAVNVLGSFMLGVIVTLVTERWPPTRYVRPFAAIGFCGGFTTFSTLTVMLMRQAEGGRLGLAALYLGASLVAGIAAAGAGVLVARGRSTGGRRSPIPDPDSLATLSGDRPGAVAPPPSATTEGTTS